MICLAVSILHFGMLTQSAIPRSPTREPPRYYTVQILSVRAGNPQGLLSVYQALRAKGHLAYYYPKRIGNRQYLRLRVGIFDHPNMARAYARELEQREGFEYFIAQADVAVVRFAGRFRIVTTPSGIWLVSGGAVRELYSPATGWIDIEHATPQVSPDGAAIAFYTDRRILKVVLETGETRTLRQSAAEENLLNSVVRWSSDGRYIAYLDAVGWELPTRLWVMRADGTENRCLIGDQSGQTKVKSTEWRPDRNRVFHVIGPTHGTVSVGGSLCSIDLDGTRTTIVGAQPDLGMEVCSDFRIAGGFIEYRTARHKPDGAEPQYTFHRRILSELD